MLPLMLQCCMYSIFIHVTWYCEHVVCLHIISWYCEHVVCIHVLSWYCEHVVCIHIISWYCEHVVCIHVLSWYCEHVVCIHVLSWYCEHVVCIHIISWYCEHVVCIHVLSWYCEHVVCIHIISYFEPKNSSMLSIFVVSSPQPWHTSKVSPYLADLFSPLNFHPSPVHLIRFICCFTYIYISYHCEQTFVLCAYNCFHFFASFFVGINIWNFYFACVCVFCRTRMLMCCL